MEETVELDMYGFVFHFLPQYVYSLSPKDRSHLDDSIFMELHCPAAFDLELHKIEKGDFLFRVLTFDPPCFADMEVPMCVIVTSKDDAKLYGYFTLEKNEHFGYVTCKVDTEMHSLLNLPRWPTLPTIDSFVLAVGRMILVEKTMIRKVDREIDEEGYVYLLDGHPGIWGDENVLGVIPDWDNRYAHEELFTNILVFKDDDRVVDEHQVVYTKDGKHLLNCLNTFDEKEYRVRDGVTTICDDAFFWRKNAG